MKPILRQKKIIEKYKNLSCSIRLDHSNMLIFIIDNEDNDYSELLKIFNKYKNYNVEIKTINSVKKLNAICTTLGKINYFGNVILDLVDRSSKKCYIDGLNNNTFINLESLPSYAKIRGFCNTGIQSDFTSWAHNLSDQDKNTLFNCLIKENKALFLEEERIIKAFYSELIKAYPSIMLYDEKDRFEKVFEYVSRKFPYDWDAIGPDHLVKSGHEYAHSAIETYKRREGVCNGRSNLLTLVTNNNLLKCNSISIDGNTDSNGGLPHTWNVFIDKAGNGYQYDLSYSSFYRRSISDLGKRSVDKVYNYRVQRLLDAPELPLRKRPAKNMIFKPLPPRREE